MTARQDALLCSINARLGHICRRIDPGAEPPGEDLAPLGDAWLHDLVALQEAEAMPIDQRPATEEQLEELFGET